VQLADTSAWIVSRRSDQADVRADFDERVRSGRIATCDMVRLELLYSARTPREYAQLADSLDALPDCPIGKPEWRRALHVYGELAARGGTHQRQVKHADLLIAAAAESAGVDLLHYDRDYEVVAGVTGQPQRWLLARGTA
jgi:predicted nucleic acid-binding protein